ncbi:MAG TPA: ABC transporter substrate-binding protein [Ramlibacter sp.]|uniref:ABC transporter substrate-binding protein n=1 Tax=Ramlibacter sp. TaxID=1917967 RepID=UPI002C6749F6|nr:ABC transporter substrate-binding protein [Ramlibacter sp.]HVZ43998.1 ABC transporter substrate-binding protein [Ramlibacter sp.]
MKPSRASRRHALRHALLAGGAAAAAIAFPVLAATSKGKGEITIAHIADVSAAQQDVFKDILIGTRAAWQSIDAKQGIRGVSVKHATFEVDGTQAGTNAAIEKILADNACVALCATAGERVALQAVNRLREIKAPIAHVAPWLQNSTLQVDERTFPIFAGRQEQLSHALRVLTEQGVQEIGVVYATEPDFAFYRTDLERIAQNLKMRLRTFAPTEDIAHFARQLTPDTPAILVFVGGTPEIIAFMQGLETSQRQRYLVALADVNLQALLQLGNARKAPVVGTQVVPVLSSPLVVVRQFKTVLARLFDEPPTPLSLAGFIAAQYTYEVLSAMEASVFTRASVLAAFQKREVMDVGGFRVAYDQQRRSASFVAQSMLTVDGRLVS